MKHASKTFPALLVAVVLAVGLAACGSSSGESTDTVSGETSAAAPQWKANGKNAGDTGPTVVVRNGEPVGGIQELEYSAGDQIHFTVESDIADEVHVHGYDLMEDIPAGGKVSFDFPAEIEGIFEVELEGRKEQIAELRVNP